MFFMDRINDREHLHPGPRTAGLRSIEGMKSLGSDLVNPDVLRR